MALHQTLHVDEAMFNEQEETNESFSISTRWSIDRQRCRLGTATDRPTRPVDQHSGEQRNCD